MEMPEPIVHTIFEKVTSTWQYIVADPSTRHAAIIDPVLDFDPAANTISTANADELLSLVKEEGYVVTHLLETHAHADHLTASHYLQRALLTAMHPRPVVCIGKRIKLVQDTFAHKYGVGQTEYSNAFDKLWDDNEEFQIGHLRAKVLYLPGHTPDHVGYMIGANVFTGDSIFNPDVGSARCDFPGGDAALLFASTRFLLSLPDHYKLYTGHDYPPQDGREPRPFSTVKEQKETNKHVGGEAKSSEFARWRARRDATLGEPRLLHQSLQVNIRGGRLPAEDQQGLRLLHIPVKILAIKSLFL